MSKKIKINGTTKRNCILISVGDFDVYVNCKELDKKIFKIYGIPRECNLAYLEKNLSRLRGFLNNPSNKELITEKRDWGLNDNRLTMCSTPIGTNTFGEYIGWTSPDREVGGIHD